MDAPLPSVFHSAAGIAKGHVILRACEMLFHVAAAWAEPQPSRVQPDVVDIMPYDAAARCPHRS